MRIIFLLLITLTSLAVAEPFWEKTSLPEGVSAEKLIVSKDNIIYAMCFFGQGLYKSTDHGTSWIRMDFDKSSIERTKRN